MNKRFFDLIASFIGLIVLSPIFLLISILIKLDSHGPIFFRQKRVGKGGKEFLIHKFRTMLTDTSYVECQITVGNDPRISRIGHYLRYYKLDELPQLIDVFIGNMSFVGPRPEVPKYMKCYKEESRDIILSVRPGITDRASIEFRNESEILTQFANPEKAYIEKILPIKEKYYIEYVKNYSFFNDLLIIFKTFQSIFYR